MSFFLVAFPALFAIVNPLGAIGPFLGMTKRDSLAKRLQTARRACMISACILIACAGLGGFVFQFFGLTLPALKIAGGALLFLVGMDMINARESGAKGTSEERAEGELKDDIAVFPLAVPLLSGPGAIASVFILGERAQSLVEHGILFLSISLTMLLSLVFLREATRIARYLGATGINVMSRLMGLILAAIAVQFILGGLLDALPGLRGVAV